MVYGLTSNTLITCVFFDFAIAKAMLQDASNPEVSSEANLDIGRVPTE